MNTDYLSKNNIFNLALIGINIFLIAFILGGLHRHHHGFGHRGFEQESGMMHHGFMHDGFRHHEFGGGMMEHDGHGWQKHGRQFGADDRNSHNSSLISPEFLFSQSEMAANRAYIKERVEHIRTLREELSKQIASGQTSSDSLKAKFAQIDGLRKDIRDHMEQKIIEKLSSMTPEEKSQLSNSLPGKNGRD